MAGRIRTSLAQSFPPATPAPNGPTGNLANKDQSTSERARVQAVVDAYRQSSTRNTVTGGERLSVALALLSPTVNLHSSVTHNDSDEEDHDESAGHLIGAKKTDGAHPSKLALVTKAVIDDDADIREWMAKRKQRRQKTIPVSISSKIINPGPVIVSGVSGDSSTVPIMNTGVPPIELPIRSSIQVETNEDRALIEEVRR